ncbi:Ribokinase [Hyphomicrobiales bacterium]|nr:Ribokinase [Hyphomicrobiales bacterium]CAH1695513.1 Ribokinase [Hyphomicrobiales bacterium]
MAAGMATSAATAIVRLGHACALWASTGTDPVGDFLIAEVAREGISTAHIRRVAGAASALASITLDDRGERIVVPYYAPDLLTGPVASPFAFSDFRGVLVDVRWPAAAALALDAARLRGHPAILDLDVGPREVLAMLLPRASHVVASLDGASILSSATSTQEAVAALAVLTDATVVVTGGSSGLSWCTSDKTVNSMPAFAVDAVDTNAAGDIFHGAFAVAMVEAMPLENALRFASAAAAIKCTRYGGRAGAPARHEVVRFLRERSR